MTRVKVSEATGAVLDWMVAKAMYGNRLVHYRTWLETTNDYWKGKDCSFAPTNEYRILSEDFDGVTTKFIKSCSTDWSQGGPIIERERLCIDIDSAGVWLSWSKQNYDDEPRHMTSGPTPLIAAMRCYVASKLGEEVEVPDELGTTG